MHSGPSECCLFSLGTNAAELRLSTLMLQEWAGYLRGTLLLSWFWHVYAQSCIYHRYYICYQQYMSGMSAINNFCINLALLLHNTWLLVVWGFPSFTFNADSWLCSLPKMTYRCSDTSHNFCLLILRGVNDMHRGVPTFIRRAQVCFHRRCDLWDNWAGVLKNNVCGGDNQDGWCLSSHHICPLQAVMVDQSGAHVGRAMFTLNTLLSKYSQFKKTELS